MQIGKYKLCFAFDEIAALLQTLISKIPREKWTGWTEVHSLVAVRIIPVVKMILQLKFISLHQNGLQDHQQLQNNLNCK